MPYNDYIDVLLEMYTILLS